MNPVPFTVDSESLEGDVRLLAVRGELDMSTAPELERELERALAEPGVSIVLDLCDCEFIDSTGIALIVRAWQQLNEASDRGLALCSNNHQVRRLLKITGVEGSIPMYEERGAALAELRG